MKYPLQSLNIGIFLLLLILSGCRGGGSSGNDGDVRFLTGTQGIQALFMKGNPPNTVYNGDTFGVGIELYNKGVSPTDVYYFFTGFDPYIFYFDHEYGVINMPEYRTQYNSEGGFEIVEAQVGVVTPPESDIFTQPLKAIICYDYQTKAEIDICIDPLPNKGDENDVCVASNGGSTGGQGAPVAISSVVQEAQPGKTRFKITVNNAGGGSVLDPRAVSYCADPRFNVRDYDKVFVDCVWLGNDPYCLPCEPNPVLLRDGSGTFYCRQDQVLGLNSYKTLLNIRLTYGYKDTIQKTITVKPS